MIKFELNPKVKQYLHFLNTTFFHVDDMSVNSADMKLMNRVQLLRQPYKNTHLSLV